MTLTLLIQPLDGIKALIKMFLQTNVLLLRIKRAQIPLK